MKMKKSVLGLILLLTIIVSAAVFAGCSTFITIPVVNNVAMSYDVLGYVGDSYASYSEAFTAAKVKFPNADAVIKIKGVLDDDFIPAIGFFGFYAIKFKTIPKEPKKSLFSK